MPQTINAIGLLRLRSAATERAALRLAVERQLGSIELAPAGLPPSAVLVVRRLADPLPGQIGADPGRVRPPAEWVRALQDGLDQAVAEAVRPGRDGRLASSAESVLFADMAELIACLVLDRVRGAVAGRWWWERASALLPGVGRQIVAAGAPARLLVVTARQLPAVFAVLHAWRAAAEVAAALDGEGMRAVLAALASAHALDLRVTGHVRESPASGVGAGAEGGGQRSAAAPSSERVGAGSLRAQTPPGGLNYESPEPWRRWLPATAAERTLSREQRCLLGLALGLHISPARVRSPAFADQVERWWRQPAGAGRVLGWQDRFAALARPALAVPPIASAGTASAEPVDGSARGADVAAGARAPSAAAAVPRRGGQVAAPEPGSSPALPSALDATTNPEPRLVERAAAGASEPNPSATPDTIGRSRRRTDPQRRTPARSQPESVSSAPSQAAVEPPASPPRPSRLQSADAATGAHTGADPGLDPGPYPPVDADPVPGSAPGPAAQPDPPSPWPQERAAQTFGGDQVATRLGGVLYLIHALEQLRIPAAFEDDFGLATRIGPWGALDLLARALLGVHWAEHAEDPLWTVLAELSAAGPDQAELYVGPALRAALDGAGRSAGCRPAYRAPPHWRTALADAAPRATWAEDAGCLWLWSNAGYVLAAVARDDRSAAEQARAELTSWVDGACCEPRPGDVAAAPLATPVGASADAVLMRWAAAAAPAVARRLRLALDAEPGDADPVHRLLSVTGVLYLTASHVDLVADLNQIWLPARRAGLDRDPGWLADYGRVVLFHYR